MQRLFNTYVLINSKRPAPIQNKVLDFSLYTNKLQYLDDAFIQATGGTIIMRRFGNPNILLMEVVYTMIVDGAPLIPHPFFIRGKRK